MKSYLLYLCFLVPVFTNVGCKKQVLPSLKETYERADKLPFGSFVAYKSLNSIYQNDVKISHGSLAVFNQTQPKKKALYMIVMQNLALTKQDVKHFLNFLDDGNDIFISADFIDPQFLNEINCSSMRIAEVLAESKGTMRNTFVSYRRNELYTPKQFFYYYFPFLNYFPHYDKRRSQVLGTNEAGLPNFIVYSGSGGRVFVHLAPRTFGNYFLLGNKNYEYLQYVLEVISPGNKTIYWDEYYKRGENLNNDSKADEKFSTLRVVKNNPALNHAFWLIVSVLLLFVFFKIKRKQRMIPEVTPPQNATVEFTKTIAALYLQRKDNKKMAEKRIAYFYESISNRYFVGGNMNQAAIFKAWAQKKGADEKQVGRLLNMIREVHEKETVSDEELIALNRLLEEF